jgi:hypothetical protein
MLKIIIVIPPTPDKRKCLIGRAFSLRSERGQIYPRAFDKSVRTWPPGLRRTRVLWKFNDGKKRRGGSPRASARVQHLRLNWPPTAATIWFASSSTRTLTKSYRSVFCNGKQLDLSPIRRPLVTIETRSAGRMNKACLGVLSPGGASFQHIASLVVAGLPLALAHRVPKSD